MTRPRIRVIKVGGSLLDEPRLPHLLQEWLGGDDEKDVKHDPDAVRGNARIDVIIAGGGSLVDQIRQLDQRFQLDASTSHWLCINAMRCTALLLARLLDIGPPTLRWDQIESLVAARRPQAVVFDVHQFLSEQEPNLPGERLTLDWRTTSDSIAARVARSLGADTLVLLKSTDLPQDVDWSAAAAQGLVDEHFPRVVDQLPRVVWVNLRRTPPAR